MSAERPRFGDYELIARLATGGMAEIFLAKRSGIAGFEKLVVIKRILPHLARQQEFIRMFFDEARIAARLNHPNVVQIYDLGQIGDNYFIAMEYLEGESLAYVMRHLKRRRMRFPPYLAAGIVLQVCEGLHYAHTVVGPDGEPLGVIHRDINPQNIFILYTGGVKIIDFGIAKAQGRFAHTSTGYLKGKYGYMSPEQIKNLPLDARSDIYSLGVVLWEMLTGRKLFHQSSELEVLKAITEQNPPPPSSLVPELPRQFDSIVQRALNRSRELRYQTAGELRLELSFLLKKSEEPSDSVAIGEFMQLLFAERMEQKRALIKEAQQSANGRLDQAILARLHPERSDTEPSISAGTPPGQRTPTPTTGDEGAPNGPPTVLAQPGQSVTTEKGSSSGGRFVAVWLAVLSIVVLGIGAFVLWRLSPLDRDSGGANGGNALKAELKAEGDFGKKAGALPERVEKTGSKPPASEQINEKASVAARKVRAKPEKKGFRAGRKRRGANRKGTAPGTAGRRVHAGQSGHKTNAAGMVAVPAGRGKLRLSTVPWTTIFLGNKKLGPTPLVDIELPAGRHKLRAVNKDKGIDREIEVDIKPNETTAKVFQF